MTESERLFEAFCQQKGIVFERIPEGASKAPDYRLSIQNDTLIVEVKQIEPNSQEKSLLTTPLDEWDPENVYHWGLPGQRIRKKISDGVPQLRELSGGRYPTMLVIFNMVSCWPELADDYAIQVAMYGIESALISKEVAPEGGAKIVSRWQGAKKQLTREHNTSLSGLAVMTLERSEVILQLYHNYYAAVSLPKRELSKLGLRQFEMPCEPLAKFPKWREIVF